MAMASTTARKWLRVPIRSMTLRSRSLPTATSPATAGWTLPTCCYILIGQQMLTPLLVSHCDVAPQGDGVPGCNLGDLMVIQRMILAQ
jgi:hypothetical protein